MSRNESPSLAKWNAELAFRPVVEATADKAGLEFLHHLVKNLAQALDVEHAFVAEFAGAADTVRTIAFWSGEDWRSNVTYALAGTPCERVVAGEFCLYKDDVQRLFPTDSDLATLGARSYLGVPLRGAQGQTLGHLAALDTRPMLEDPRGMALFEKNGNFNHLPTVAKKVFDVTGAGDTVIAVMTAMMAAGATKLEAAYIANQAAGIVVGYIGTAHVGRDELFDTIAEQL